MIAMSSKYSMLVALVAVALGAVLLAPLFGFSPLAQANGQPSSSVSQQPPAFANSSTVSSSNLPQTPQRLYKPLGESLNVTIVVASAVSLGGSATDPAGTVLSLLPLTIGDATALNFYVGPESQSGYYVLQVNLVAGPDTVIIENLVSFTNFVVPFTPPALHPQLP